MDPILHVYSTECVQRNPATKHNTIHEYEEIVKEWLRGAKDRDGGRQRRQSQQQESSQDTDI